MTRIRTRSSSLLLAVGLALGLAACGGSNAANVSHHRSSGSAGGQTSAAAATPGTSTGSTTTTTASTTSTSSTTTNASSGGAGLPSSSGGVLAGKACTASDLAPAFLNSNGAAGHVVIAFVLRNTGSAACYTYGFPGVEFLTKTGAPITTNATRTTNDFAGDLPESNVKIAAGSEASFRMVTSDVGSSQSACQTAGGLQIYAPSDTVAMRVKLPEGISVCDGKATVSPVVSGTTASST